MSPLSTLTVEVGLAATLPASLPAATARFLLTDAHVAPLLSAAWRDMPSLIIPPGEASKSWAQLGEVLAALDAAGLDRDGQLVAVGGGVVTDLGGLAASLHRRGIPWVAVPTSLVGQVDAGLGGKTAVNLGGGKNTVGTFHQPHAVLVDPTFLSTLPPRHLHAGYAEMLKTSLIAGDPLWSAVLALSPGTGPEETAALAACVAGCLATKQDLVERDPFDRGPRRLLNLGHTFGHAFEALALSANPEAQDPETLLHGEAVGLGLLCAARLGGQAQLESTLRAQLRAWALPTTTDLKPGAVLREMGRDKKRLAGTLTAVIPMAPGTVTVREGVAEADLLAALAAVRPA